MRASNPDAPLIARRIGEFLHEYAPHTLGRSPHTVKSYSDSLTLYVEFLEAKG